MKAVIRFANASRCIAIVLTLLFLSGGAMAQVTPVTINPTGGNAGGNDLRITITDTSVQVRHNGADQFSLDPMLDRYARGGLRTYFSLEQELGPKVPADINPQYLKHCEISEVSGDGSAANPWKVVAQSSIHNKRGYDYFISTTYKYIAGNKYYTIDFMVTSSETAHDGTNGGTYWLHFYLSEASFMGGSACAKGFKDGVTPSTMDHYYSMTSSSGAVVDFYSTIGVTRTTGECGATSTTTHVFKTEAPFSSFASRPFISRDDRNGDFLLTNVMTDNAPLDMGITVHKAVEIVPHLDLTTYRHASKQFVVGFDRAEINGVTPVDPPVPAPGVEDDPMRIFNATVNFASAAPEGVEGNSDHAITGLELMIGRGQFNLPQILEVVATPLGAGAGHAVPGTDYEVIRQKIIIEPGRYWDSVVAIDPIKIKGNTIVDNDRKFRVELRPLTCSPHLLLGTNNVVEYTIIDDDENRIFLEPVSTAVREGENVRVKVKVTGITPLASDLTVTLTKPAVGEPAAETTDYSGIPNSVTIPAGQWEAFFDMTATADRILEENEKIDIEATAVFPTKTSTHKVTVTIVDTTGLNPDNRVITLSVPQGKEGETVAVKASLPDGVTTEKPITVNIDLADPSNTADASDVSTMPNSITIPAYGNSEEHSMFLEEDFVMEEFYEYWNFDGSASDHDGAFTVMPGTLIIEDSPVGRELNVLLMSGPTAYENGSQVTIMFEMTGFGIAPPGGIRFPIQIKTVDPATDADINDIAYTGNFEVEILENESYGEYTFTIPNDPVWLEGMEKLHLSGSKLGFTFLNDVMVKIVDNTAGDPDNLRLIVEGPANVEEGNTGTITARLAKPALKHKGAVQVDLTFDNSTAIPADYTLPDTKIIIPQGDNSASITLTAVTDALIEPEDTLKVVGSATLALTPAVSDTAKIAILAPPSTKIKFTATPLTLTEGPGGVTVTASLEYGTAAADIPITLNIGSGSTAEAADFTTTPASIKIPAGSQSGTFTIYATDDQLLEIQESLELSGQSTGYTFEGLTFQITDLQNSNVNNKKISIQPQAATLNENGDLTVWVRLPSGIKTSEAITVNLGRGAASSADLQTLEYTMPASVIIPAMGSEISFTLHANADNVLEADELLEIEGSATVWGTAQTGKGNVTIKDVRTTAMKQLVVTGPTEVTEGFTGNWRIALPAGVTSETPITVNIAVATVGNTTTGADFTGGYPVSATIPKGQPHIDVPFVAKADNIVEGMERLEMTLSSTDGFTFTQQIGMNVKDTDPAGLQIRLTAGATTLNEGAATVITATLDGFTATSDIDVVLSAHSASTATVTDDYDPLGTIHINAGANSGTFTLQTKSDLLLEPDELIAVRGASTYTVVGEDITVKDVTGTNANKTLSLTPVTASVNEGSQQKMTVSLPAGIKTTQAITVTITKGAGSAATITASDYTMPATVVIPAMGNEVQFDLDANTDGIIEPAELLQVSVSGTVFGFASSDVSDITINDVSNKQITVTGPATVAEGGDITWRFALPSGVTSTSDINIALAHDPTSTATLADLTAMPALKITAGQPFGEIIFNAKADQLIESTETLKFTPSASAGFTFTQPVSFTITDNDLAAAGIALSFAPNPVAEGGSTVIKATLTGGVKSAGDITVTLAKSATSTLSDGEHGTPGNIVIAAGDTEGTLTLTTTTDLLLEPTETLVVTGTATSAIPVTGATLNVTDATGTLANKTLQISPLTATLLEGSDLEITVGLPANIITTQDITVTLTKGAGSAASLTATDYGFPATALIEAGQNNAKFILQAKSDGQIEAAELLELKANASVFGNNSTATSQITITDVSNKHITVSGPATVAEGNNITWRFALPAGVTATSDINIALTRNSASTAVMADLGALPALKIAAGQPFGEIIFAAPADQLIEAGETMIFDAAATGFTFSQPVTFTITDSDLAAAGITLSATPATVAEGGSSVIKATLTGGVTSAGSITVALAKDGASTLGGAEHGALGNITIAAGATEGTVTVTTNTDAVLEPTETLVIGGSATSSIPVTGTTLSVTDATGTNANKTISLTPATATIVESGKVTMTVSLPAGITTAGPITINLAKGAGSAASLTASDYSFPATVTIDAGGDSKSFDVTAVADALIEAPELLELTATATVYGYTSSDVSNITITDVSNKHITVSGPATGAEGSTITWRFELPAGVTATSDINISLTADPGATASLADLTGIPSLKILAGAPFADITFTAKADQLIESAETLVLNPSTISGFTFSQPVTFSISDGDLSAAGITLSATPSGVAEGGSTVIKAILTGGVKAADDVIVTLSKDGASTLGNTEHGTLGTITIPAGSTEGTFTLTTNTDLLLETTETLVLAGTATNSIPVTGITVTVTDATGSAANKTLQLTPATATVAEGGKVTMTIALPTNIITTQAITVTLTKGAGSSASLTASDYSFPATVTIDANSNSKTFDVSALTDGNIETNETLGLNVAGTVFGFASTAVSNITITDVSNKTISVSGPATVAEGSNIVYRFGLPSGVTAATDINIALTADAASTATLADLTALPAVKIPAGQPFVDVTFAAKADLQIEPTETLTLNPSAAGFTFAQPVTFTITDGDLAAAGIQLSAAPATIAEGAGTVIKATLTGGVTAKDKIVITLTKDGASTLGNSEHSSLGTIEINGGDTEGTFTLTTNADLLLEPTETLVLGGTASPAIPVSPVTVSVTDATGSNANKTLQLTPATATIMEGGKVTMTVALPAGILSTQAIVVALTRGAGSSASLAAGEYSFPATVTIDPLTNSATFDVEAIADGNIESPEQLELVGSGTVSGFASTDKSAITITDVSNKHITVTGPATVAEGSSITYRFGLPTGVTASSDIIINLAVDAAATATLGDLTGLPVVKIPAGQPFVDITFTAKADGLIEPGETLILNPSAATFTFSQPASFTITDSDLAAAGITLSVAPASLAEGGSTVVKATLTGGVTATAGITVTLAKGGASTLSDTEHSALGVITVPAGATEGTFTLSTNTDLLLEPSETLVIGGTANPNIPVTGTTLTVTDATGTNANKTLQFTPAVTSVAEGNKVVMTVALPANIITTQPISVTLAKSAGSAATLMAGDYDFPATVTIAAGANSQTFEVEAATDDIIESAELLQINASANVFGFATTKSADITITDVSNKLITVAGPATVVEGNTVTWTFSLPAGVTSEQPVVINLAQGTSTPAAAAADLEGGFPVSVTIPAGSPSMTLDIETKTDDRIETVEKLELVPSAAGGFTFNKSVQIDIHDAPVTGNISMTASAATIREGASGTTITVALPGSYIAGSNIVVNITRNALSSAANIDHSALPASVTIGDGQHSATFTVSAATDNILEQLESLQLEGTAAGFTVDGISISLEDATSLDPANTKISLLPAGARITEGTVGQFRLSLPAGITSSTDIAVQLAKVDATSTAADTDHGAIPALVTIPALAASSADFAITAAADGILEPVEVLRIGGNPPAGFSFEEGVIEIADGTGLIPANRLITITIDSTTLHEGNTAKVKFSLPAGITTALPITITVGANAAQTATAADFSISPLPVAIGAGQQDVTVQLTAVQDMIAEVAEVLQITAAATGFTFAPASTITIPGEPAPGLSVTLTKTADAAEPSSNGTFRIQLASGTAPADITVLYTTGGTATSTKDYTALSGTAVIKAGDAGVNVNVNVLDDKILENNETITMTLVSGSFDYLGASVPVNIATAGAMSMTLADDDASIDRSILIEKIADAAEPATQGRVRVRFANTDLTTVVPVNVTYNIGGTASAGADYQVLTGSIDIPAGQKEAIITIQPVNDLILEGSETIVITLSAASAPIGSYTWPIAAQNTATVNLHDDDQIKMEVTAPVEITEGGNMTATLRSSEAFPTAIPVKITLTHDAVRSVSTATPRTGTTLTVTMPANQTEVTFQLTSDENDTNDDDGYINLAILPHSGAGQPYGVGAADRSGTVVKDNDALVIGFASDSARIGEGNSGMAMLAFKVTLSRKSTRPIELQYAFADAFEGQGAGKDPQRAKSAEDFQDATRKIVIAAGEVEGVIEVPVIGDVNVEEDEFFAVKLTAAVVASSQNVPTMGTAAVAVGVILNDDVIPDMEIRVHKGLSPNGDGKNDALVIENVEKYVRNEIVIVNRWGGTIFQTTNYHNQNNAFKGIANRGGGNGSRLPDGSYFYVLQVWDADGKMTRFTGYIVLKSAQ
ncbi:Calx-beta domain-containing protein [Chitinophaga rhizosphaerae]|uniref:Calx-beta domain-containing protein n=1 Tax=Chitinophaga rhizosphaerae TaxID=1864947 RepID=UPI0013DF170C|nr:Calx-beta domain-containing protein [Chitinophaga rhizosphaerae]